MTHPAITPPPRIAVCLLPMSRRNWRRRT